MNNTQKAMNGGKWITIATVISTLFQFGQVAVLARLLAPADFGLVSVSTLIINFFGMFANLGFSNSIIYKQEGNQRVLSTLYWLNLMVGFVIFGIVQLSAPIIAGFYHEPRLELVVRLASGYFVIVYFGQLYYFLFEKELQFRLVAVVDMAGTFVGTATTIMLAYNGFAELSLIIGALVMQTVRSTLQIVLGRRFFRPVWAFNLRDVGEHLRFGVYNLGDGLLGFAHANFDNMFIGGVLGVQALGYYTIAFQLAIFPIIKLNPIILQVAYPILARMKDNTTELKKSYLKILDFLSYCNLPLLAGLFITADTVVPLLYGPGWEKTIELIQIFVFIGVVSCLNHPLYTLVFTKGKPNLLFYLNLGTLLVKVPLVYVFAQYGQVTGIALAFLLTTILNLVVNFMIVQSLIGDFFGEFLKNFAKPVAFCGVMVAVIAGYKAVFGPPDLLGTVVEIMLGGAVYAGLTLAFKLSLAEVLAYRRSLL